MTLTEIKNTVAKWRKEVEFLQVNKKIIKWKAKDGTSQEVDAFKILLLERAKVLDSIIKQEKQNKIEKLIENAITFEKMIFKGAK